MELKEAAETLEKLLLSDADLKLQYVGIRPTVKEIVVALAKKPQSEVVPKEWNGFKVNIEIIGKISLLMKDDDHV